MKAVHFFLVVIHLLCGLAFAKGHPVKELFESPRTINRDELVRIGLMNMLTARMEEGTEAYNLWLRQNPQFLTGLLTMLDEAVVGQLLSLVDKETLDLATDSSGRTLLHKVVVSGREGVVKLLLDRGLNPNKADNVGFSALDAAVTKKHIPMISVLVQNGGRIVNDGKALASLLTATKTCDRELFKILLDALEDAPSKLALATKFDAFSAAAVQCDAEFVDMLLQHGEGFEGRTEDGKSWLTKACAAGNEEVAGLLLKYKVDVNAKDVNGFSSLHAAASAGSENLVSLLLDNGANLEASTANGETPLFFSFDKEDSSATSLLIQRGANVTHRDFRELTPLHRAAMLDNAAAVALLLKSEAEIDAADSNGFTPLMVAIENRSSKVVEVLLDAGADVWIRGPGGVSALLLAARVKDMSLLQRLTQIRRNQRSTFA